MKKHFISMHIEVCATNASNGPLWSSAEQQTHYSWPKSCKAETYNHKLKLSKCHYDKNPHSSERMALWAIWRFNHGTFPWTVPYGKCLPLKNNKLLGCMPLIHYLTTWINGFRSHFRKQVDMRYKNSFDTIKLSTPARVQYPYRPVLDLS